MISLVYFRSSVCSQTRECMMGRPFLIYNICYCSVLQSRPLVKSAYQKNDFLISQPIHMLWVLKRTVFMRWPFEHPKHMLKFMGKKIFTILR